MDDSKHATEWFPTQGSHGGTKLVCGACVHSAQQVCVPVLLLICCSLLPYPRSNKASKRTSMKDEPSWDSLQLHHPYHAQQSRGRSIMGASHSVQPIHNIQRQIQLCMVQKAHAAGRITWPRRLVATCQDLVSQYKRVAPLAC
jgi:hypothetical protein